MFLKNIVMKKNSLILLAAIALGVTSFTSCESEEKDDAVMVILKMKDPNNCGYWEQIGTAVDSECSAKGLKAIIRYTESDADYDSQLAALDEMEKLDYNYKGIIAVPIYSVGNHKVEERIAVKAEKYGIPVIVMDTPVKAGESPLDGKYRTYVGTDNSAAGQMLAEYIGTPADNILAACSKASNAGHLRYDGFCGKKGMTALWEATEAEAVNIGQQLASHPDASTIVYFNGSLSGIGDVLDTLDFHGKSAYTFDAFGVTLQALANAYVVKGILAQQTFEMGRQAVDAVLNANVKNPLYIAPVYITPENLKSAEVKPFLDFFKIELK